MYRRIPTCGHGVNIGTAFDKEFSHILVASIGCSVQRRKATIVSSIEVRAAHDKYFSYICMTLFGSTV